MELAEIDTQSAIVAMEAKIGKLEEMAKAKEDEWCHYSGMPSPSSYEQKTKRGKRS